MTRLAKAILIGPSAHKGLEQDSGKVHSVFKRIFNILIDSRLVGIARSGVAPSPINVVTDIPPDENMSSLGINKEMTIRRDDKQLLIDNVLEISLEHAELWKPKTRARGHLDLEIVGRNLELAKRLAVGIGEEEGLGQLLPSIGDIALGKAPQIPGLNRVAEKAIPQIISLIESARKNDVEGVREGSQNLVGLGQGLSPSSDDMLSGFMVAHWWVTHSLEGNIGRVQAMNEAIISSREKTTLMSQQLLEHAAKGKTNEAVEELLEAILTGTAASVEAGVKRVSGIGGTSGIDIMVGLLLGLEVSLEKIG